MRNYASFISFHPMAMIFHSGLPEKKNEVCILNPKKSYNICEYNLYFLLFACTAFQKHENHFSAIKTLWISVPHHLKSRISGKGAGTPPPTIINKIHIIYIEFGDVGSKIIIFEG